MTEKIIQHKKINKEKLIKYGFKYTDGKYFFERHILDGQMSVRVLISENGKIDTVTTDVLSDEEYTLHRVKGVSGEYVGRVKAEYESLLLSIAEKCFDPEIFKSKQTKRVIEYVRQKYGDLLEHLWEKAPDNAIFRRKDTNKWYAAILTVSRKKLGFSSNETVEIIDLHADPEKIPHMVDNVKLFPGFHMNKKHWITICLDGTVSDDFLFKKIDESYLLGAKKNAKKK